MGSKSPFQTLALFFSSRPLGSSHFDFISQVTLEAADGVTALLHRHLSPLLIPSCLNSFSVFSPFFLSFFVLHSLCFKHTQCSHHGYFVAIKTIEGQLSPILEALVSPHLQVPLHPATPVCLGRAKMIFSSPAIRVRILRPWCGAQGTQPSCKGA